MQLSVKWVYVDDERGECGYFSDLERAELDSVGRGGYTWRRLSTTEIDSFGRYIGQLSYDQS